MITATEFIELFSSDLFLQALIATVLVGALCGLLSPLTEWKDLGLMSDALAHSSLLGIAGALIFKLSPLWVGLVFLLGFSQVLAFFELRKVFQRNSVLAMMFAGCFALGVLLLHFFGQGSSEMIHLFLGDVLVVTENDLILLGIELVLVLIYLAVARKSLLLLLLQSDLAEVEGVSLKRHLHILYALFALTVAIGLKIMGVILLTSLLVVPAMISKTWVKHHNTHFYFSVAVGVIVSVLGLVGSFLTDAPTGPVIACVGTLAFFISFFIRRIVQFKV